MTATADRFASTAPWARRLPLAALTCALLAMLGDLLGREPLLWLFKPLTTIVIIAFASARGGAEPLLRRWLLAGLVLSLGGDIALLWPQQGFLPGLVSFLLAHLAYLRAFTRDTRFAARPLAFALYAAAAGALLALLWPGVPAPLRVPVIVYVVALASMAAQALARAWQHRREPAARGTRIAAIGGALFVASDALIALDRFHTPIPHVLVAILALYWLAQWCIASSLPASTPRAAGANAAAAVEAA
jgi:uncharacterized membrane protein YhhN